jgi:DNA repair protein RecN (Recombination protein N)
MLRELRIRNIAIIDDLTLTFGNGLNVITGETGAGKSIILQSLALLCGARGAADLVRADADEAIVEGLFECSVPEDVRVALGLDEGEEVVVRRHLGRTGKGRVLINGSPAILSLLGRLGDFLVHIYGQHDQALLLRPASHLELIDKYGNLGADRQRMGQAYAQLVLARRRQTELAERVASLWERRELLDFQRGELREAAPRAGEPAALTAERELLRHAERIQAVCGEGEASLYSSPGSAVDTLVRLHQRLVELAPIAPGLAAIADMVEGGRVQLEEAALEMRAMGGRLESDPARLEEVETRLAVLHRLGRKFGVEPEKLPETLAAVERDLDALSSQDDDARRADAEVATLTQEALRLAARLTVARTAAVERLTFQMRAELAALGMHGAELAAVQEVGGEDALGADGVDRIEFLLQANAGELAKPLARIASGGELSRIMLALKALTASVGETPVLLFDEVDAGIGGTVADAVARRLAVLSGNHQILCITHLAQIAAYADHHFAVEKAQISGRTLTQARALDAAERVAEVSRMLGGGQAPAEAGRYARRLIAEAQRVRLRPQPQT